MYSIEQFQALNNPENMIITQHSRKRFVERNIRISDIINAFASGEIIEDYSDDYPFPSCLVLWKSEERKIHVVAGINEDLVYIITAYIPDPLKWDAELKKRREESWMKCMRCGREAFKSTTTEAIELEKGVLVIRNIPCYKCEECDEIYYTGDVVEKLEKITDYVKKLMQEVTVIDYSQIEAA